MSSVVPTGPTTGSFPLYRVWRGSAWVTLANYLRVDVDHATNHSEREFLNKFRSVSGSN